MSKITITSPTEPANIQRKEKNTHTHHIFISMLNSNGE